MSEERQTSQSEDRYLTPAEAAAYLKISLSWVRKCTRAGLLPHAQLGWRIVYDRVDLDEFITSRKRAASWEAWDGTVGRVAGLEGPARHRSPRRPWREERTPIARHASLGSRRLRRLARYRRIAWHEVRHDLRHNGRADATSHSHRVGQLCANSSKRPTSATRGERIRTSYLVHPHESSARTHRVPGVYLDGKTWSRAGLRQAAVRVRVVRVAGVDRLPTPCA